jgi:hypothetical protein
MCGDMDRFQRQEWIYGDKQRLCNVFQDRLITVQRSDWQFPVVIKGPQAAKDMAGVHQDIPDCDDEELVRKKKLLLLGGIRCSPCCRFVHAMQHDAAACNYIMCSMF